MKKFFAFLFFGDKFKTQPVIYQISGCTAPLVTGEFPISHQSSISFIISMTKEEVVVSLTISVNQHNGNEEMPLIRLGSM